jgi:L-iditol 2-dehydrogenase
MVQATMRAVVKFGPGVEGIEIREIPIPVAAAGQAVIEVMATGICGTDVHLAHDEYPHERPVVLGHEVLGIVSSVGTDSDSSWLGAKVAVETYFSACEKCPMCRAGRRNLCKDRLSIGSFRNGGFASHLLVPVLNLHLLPDLPGEFDGVLSEPLACVAQCLLDPPVIQPGDSVLVIGPGTMGQLAAQVAHASGAKVTLFGLASDQSRLEVAKSLGIKTSSDVPAEESFDVIIECSGSSAGAAAGLKAAKRGGKYVQVGIFGKDVVIPMDLVLYKELTLSSGFASTPNSWLYAMRLINSGSVNLTPLITRQMPLDEFFQALSGAQQGEGLKTIILGR